MAGFWLRIGRSCEFTGQHASRVRSTHNKNWLDTDIKLIATKSQRFPKADFLSSSWAPHFYAIDGETCFSTIGLCSSSIKNGAVSLSPRQRRVPGARTPDWVIIPNEKDRLWLDWLKDENSAMRPMPYEVGKQRCHAHGRLQCSNPVEGTWGWSNNHSWMNEIARDDHCFWPDCSPWTKIPTKLFLNRRRAKALEPGSSATVLIKASRGCSTAKMNCLKMSSEHLNHYAEIKD